MISLVSKVFESPLARWLQNLISAVFILLFLIHSVLSVSQISKTFDESTHYKFGLNLLHGNAERPWESVMPISAWNALPRFISELEIFPNGPLRSSLGTFLAARLMTIVFACGIAYLVFHFSRLLYGFIPALFSLFLFIFDPNILAHSQLVTTDIFVTGSLLLVVFSAWRYAQHRSWTNKILFALSLGFALITKYTAMSFAPLLFFVLVLYDLAHIFQKHTYNKFREFFYLLREYFTLIFLVTVVSILILNIAYLFRRTFVPFGDYTFRETIFINLKKDYPFLNAIPVPVPYAHLQGFDWILAFEHTGEGHGNHYLLGEIRQGYGFPGYYIIAFILKEPFPAQIIIYLSFIVYFIDKNRRSHFWQQEIFLFVPIAFYSIYFNFFYNSQIGIRYYLVVFPLLYIFAGSLFVKWGLFSRKKKILSILLNLYLVVSVMSYFPYYLPYFNEIVWKRSNAYRYLADSNLDWGQGRNEFEQYLIDNPRVSYPTRYVRAGKFIVSANDLVGITKDPAVYAWLRDNFEPVDTVAYSYLIYQITSDEKRELCLTTSYCASK